MYGLRSLLAVPTLAAACFLLAPAAQAHHPEVTAYVSCADGQAVLNWESHSWQNVPLTGENPSVFIGISPASLKPRP